MPFERPSPMTFIVSMWMPLCAAHRGVGAGGAHRAALLGAEVPVEQSDRDDREHEAHSDRLRHIERREQEALRPLQNMPNFLMLAVWLAFVMMRRLME